MIREQALRARQKLVGKLPVTGELLRGSLLERTVRHTKDCPKCARGEGHQVQRWVGLGVIADTTAGSAPKPAACVLDVRRRSQSDPAPRRGRGTGRSGAQLWREPSDDQQVGCA